MRPYHQQSSNIKNTSNTGSISSSSTVSMSWKHARLYLLVLGVAGFMWVVSMMLYAALKIFPEVGMVVQSQCKNRFRDWDGKFWKVQVGKNYVAARPRPRYSYIKENIGTFSHDRRRRLQGGDNNGGGSSNDGTTGSKLSPHHMRPLILWGSHHKTGTYVAQKIFSLICSQMRWCCSFHVTRESVYSMKDALVVDDVDVMGHTQWIWHPREFGVPYKFIHFYRHPFKKIISGYRYHRDGAEAWTTKRNRFLEACSATLPLFANRNGSKSIIASTSSTATRHGDGSGSVHNNSSPADSRSIARSTVVNFCRSIHLCESCCRREHEASLVSTTASNSSLHPPSLPRGKPRAYAVRGDAEYRYLCEHLARPVGTASLSDALIQRSVEEGLAVEAALEYYENLRMARVYNLTIDDPNSLHIDVDDLVDNYSSTMRRILRHMEVTGNIPPATHEAMLEDLEFFNLESSWLYRLGMNNLNHIGYKRKSYQSALMARLKSNEAVMKAYAPILELMPKFRI